MMELGKPKLDFWLLALNQPINGITYDKLEEAFYTLFLPNLYYSIFEVFLSFELPAYSALNHHIHG